MVTSYFSGSVTLMLFFLLTVVKCLLHISLDSLDFLVLFPLVFTKTFSSEKLCRTLTFSLYFF